MKPCWIGITHDIGPLPKISVDKTYIEASNRERLSGMEIQNTVRLPAPNQQVEKPVCVVAKSLPPAERKLIQEVAHKPMFDVKTGSRIVQCPVILVHRTISRCIPIDSGIARFIVQAVRPSV